MKTNKKILNSSDPKFKSSTMTVGFLSLLIAFGLSLSTPVFANDSVEINPKATELSVSGLSSGGYFATQFMLAHADKMLGAAILAAGPYYCAQNSISTALAECVTETTEEFSIEPVMAYLKAQQSANKIADNATLSSQNVLIVHGKQDNRVNAKAVSFLNQQMTQLGISNTKFINDIESGHNFPTLANGNECKSSASPFIGNCGVDMAGEIFTHIYEDVTPATAAKPENLKSFTQHDVENAESAELAETGFVYVPDSCQSGESCRVHVSFHGCNQSFEMVGDAYTTQTGLNDWAESNSVIVVYPQVEKSTFMPINPQGCWDWWGYTGDDYATKDGAQIKVINAMLKQLPSLLSNQ